VSREVHHGSVVVVDGAAGGFTGMVVVGALTGGVVVAGAAGTVVGTVVDGDVGAGRDVVTGVARVGVVEAGAAIVVVGARSYTSWYWTIVGTGDALPATAALRVTVDDPTIPRLTASAVAPVAMTPMADATIAALLLDRTVPTSGCWNRRWRTR
jgi:hypothetical protein